MASPRFAWGIDVGNRALKAVKLVRDPEAAIETLFAAHFAEGEDIGDRETVLRLLPDVDPAALDRGEGARAVDDDLEVAQQIGVTGVPSRPETLRPIAAEYLSPK